MRVYLRNIVFAFGFLEDEELEGPVIKNYQVEIEP